MLPSEQHKSGGLRHGQPSTTGKQQNTIKEAVHI
jgi:hypothetical protein